MNLDGYKIDEVWDALSEKHKAVIEGRYFVAPPKTFTALGKELGLSHTRISQIEKEALYRMRNQFWRKDCLSTVEEIRVPTLSKETEAVLKEPDYKLRLDKLRLELNRTKEAHRHKEARLHEEIDRLNRSLGYYKSERRVTYKNELNDAREALRHGQEYARQLGKELEELKGKINGNGSGTL